MRLANLYGVDANVAMALAHLSFDSDAGSRTLGLAHPKRESYHMTK